MPFKIESKRIEIDSNVSILERILTGSIAGYILFMLLGSPHGFWHSAFSEKDIPFLIKLPSVFASALFTLGAFYLLYRSISKPKKEIIKWNNDELVIHFGTYSLKKRGVNPDLDLFIKKYEFNQSEVTTIKLMSFAGGNELCIDKGKKRIRIGTTLSEPEKERLFEILKKGAASLP